MERNLVFIMRESNSRDQGKLAVNRIFKSKFIDIFDALTKMGSKLFHL